MRLLVDANLSPRLLPLLADAGHDVAHVFDLGLGQADDATIMARALPDDRAGITADTNFVTMLALTGAAMPSVVLVRRATGRRAHELAASRRQRGAARGRVAEPAASSSRSTASGPSRSSRAPRGKPAEARGHPVTSRYQTTLRTPRDLRFRARTAYSKASGLPLQGRCRGFESLHAHQVRWQKSQVAARLCRASLDLLMTVGTAPCQLDVARVCGTASVARRPC